VDLAFPHGFEMELEFALGCVAWSLTLWIQMEPYILKFVKTYSNLLNLIKTH
jgi:hypothetical protein